MFDKKQQLIRSSKAKHVWREWVSSLVFAVLVVTCIRWMLIASYVIPSVSMEPTLLKGDFVLVSKIHYGARLPVTPLQLPLTHRVIPGTTLPAYLDWIQLTPYRLPRLFDIQRNDIVVFNAPIAGTGEPFDLRDYWIKRCVALPGDELYIVHKQLYVNGSLVELCNREQYCYFMKTKSTLSDTFFKRNDIKQYTFCKQLDETGYVIYTKPEKIKKMMAKLPTYIVSINPVEDNAVLGCFQSHSAMLPRWTKDNYGPIVLPKKGMAIPIDEQHVALYRATIERFEGRKDIRFTRDSCWIDGERVKQYVFGKNYYFVMGDNRDQSMDSRFVGFIPEDYIVGKAVIVPFSLDKDQGWLKGIRWNRLFQVLN